MRTSGVWPTRPATPSAMLARSSAQLQRSPSRGSRRRQARAEAAPVRAPSAKRRKGEEEEEEVVVEGGEEPPLLAGDMALVSSRGCRGRRERERERERERKG